MLKLKWLGALLCLTAIVIGLTSAKKSSSVSSYINKYSGIAVSEMKRSGIPASITLAQGILESSSGGSYLSRKGNNHFGIKCHSSWKGKRLFAKDDRKDDCFRCYKNANESFKDHTNFLVRNSRYNFLFKGNNSDYKFWAKGLLKAGYATDKKYAKSLISVVKRYNLDKYDKWLKNNKVTKPSVKTASKSSSTKKTTKTTTKPKTEKKAPRKEEKAVKTKVTVDVQDGIKVGKFDKDVTLKQVAAVFKLTEKEVAAFNKWKTSDMVQAGTFVKLQSPSEKLPFWKQLSDIGAWANLYGIKDKILGKSKKKTKPIIFDVSLTATTATVIESSTKKEAPKPAPKKSSEKGEKKVTEKTSSKPKVKEEKKDKKEAVKTTKKEEKKDKKEAVKTTKKEEKKDKKEAAKTAKKEVKKEVKKTKDTKKKEEKMETKKTPTPTKLTRVHLKPQTKIHKVKPGENLYRIARKYGMTVDQLKANNQLKNNNLDINQALKVNI